VLAVERPANDRTVVVVLPITHTPPADSASAVEIPTAVKRHLELDDDRSWIVVTEGNEFDWPGYDIRKIGRSDRYDYGFLPPRFFKQVIEAFIAWHRARKVKLTSRECPRNLIAASLGHGEPKRQTQKQVNHHP